MLRSGFFVLLSVGFLASNAKALGDGDHLRWQDQFDLAGATDQARSITLSSHRGYWSWKHGEWGSRSGGPRLRHGDRDASVARSVSACFRNTHDCESLLRSYDARTGRLIWEHQAGIPQHAVSALALVVGPGFILIAGEVTNLSNIQSFWCDHTIQRAGSWLGRIELIAVPLALLSMLRQRAFEFLSWAGRRTSPTTRIF